MINGTAVQKNKRYGEPVQMLMSDMKYALSKTQPAECKTIAE